MKQKIDQAGGDVSVMVNGEGFVVTDRNSLVQRLKGLDIDK